MLKLMTTKHFFRLAVELHPTGEVSEYTATVGYELLREGEEGRQKVDMVKLVLKAEGKDLICKFML